MVKVNNISYKYQKDYQDVLKEVGFNVENGKCIAILGNNGAGKSTLLKCIDKICPTKNGEVIIDDLDVFKMNKKEMAKHISYVPQVSSQSQMTVFDTIFLGRKPYINWDATSNDLNIVNDVITELGLEDYALRNINELSGGELQKVMIARALAQKPKFLLLDEPTNNLDPYNQMEVLKIVKNIAHKNNICVAIIIHDLNLAIRYCDRFVFLKDSKVYSQGNIETVTKEVIKNVYDINVDIIEYKNRKIIIPE